MTFLFCNNSATSYQQSRNSRPYMHILIGTIISKHSVNLLVPCCVSLSNLLANAGLSKFRSGASVPCASYGQVSYANPWVQGAMSINRPVPIMERSSLPRFCACDAWPYSEKSSRARCQLDIGLFCSRRDVFPDHGSVAETD